MNIRRDATLKDKTTTFYWIVQIVWVAAIVAGHFHPVDVRQSTSLIFIAYTL